MVKVAGHRLNNTGSAVPQMMTSVSGAYQCGVLIKLDGEALVWRRDLTKRSNDPTAYQTSDITGTARTALDLPMKGGGSDDHYSLAFLEDDQNRFHIAGNGHAVSQHYIRSNGAWPPVWTVPAYQFGGSGFNGHTYNYFDRMADGTSLWFLDQQDTASTRGRDILAMYLPPGAGTTWLPISNNLAGTGSGELFRTNADTPAGVTADRVYIIGEVVDDLGRIHVAGIFRTGDADGNTQQQPFYLHNDGTIGLGGNTHWFNIQGQQVTMPVAWATRSEVVITSAPPISRNTSWSLSLDDNYYPSIIVQNGGTLLGPSGNPPDPGPAGNPMGNLAGYGARVRLYWDGTDWQITDITSGAAGSCQGPPIKWVGGDHYVLGCAGALRQRVTNLAGAAGAINFFMGDAPIASGSETNVDPIALRAGSLQILQPDGNTPWVHTFGEGVKFNAAVGMMSYRTNPGTSLTYASPTSINPALDDVFSATTVHATGSVTFNALSVGAVSKIIAIKVTNDATSAKTITFGTNFTSAGVLVGTPSKTRIVWFVSTGTTWSEMGRSDPF